MQGLLWLYYKYNFFLTKLFIFETELMKADGLHTVFKPLKKIKHINFWAKRAAQTYGYIFMKNRKYLFTGFNVGFDTCNTHHNHKYQHVNQ